MLENPFICTRYHVIFMNRNEKLLEVLRIALLLRHFVFMVPLAKNLKLLWNIMRRFSVLFLENYSMASLRTMNLDT